MKNKQNNKNGFLITWGSCIVFLLVLCFFGISDSMKGTRAAQTCLQWSCSEGTPTGDGSKCIVMYTEKEWVEGSTSSTSCSNPGFSDCCPSGTSSSCSRDSSSGSTVTHCTCTSTGSGFYKDVEKAKTIDATCVKWSGSNTGECPAPPNCEPGYHRELNSQGCSVCVSDDPNYDPGNCPVFTSCSADQVKVLDDDGCYTCVPKYVDEDEDEDELYTCDGGKTTQTSSICEKSGSFYPGGASSATCENLYGEGWKGSCKMNTGIYKDNGDGTVSYQFDCDCTKDATKVSDEPETNSCSGISATCTYKVLGQCDTLTGKKCVYDSNSCCYVPVPDEEPSKGDQRQCTTMKDGVTGGYWGGTCTYIGSDWYCGNCTLACYPGYTREGDKCVPCEGNNCQSCEDPACYFNGSSYCWGNSTTCSGSKVNGISNANNCKANPGEPPKTDDPNPGGGGPDPGGPSGSDPGTSSDPNGSNDRGDGCYKNKDTGEFKWFDSDPELNSSTKNYEKVNDSNCKQNVTENPQTGEIAMFLIWIIAFGAVGYSVWYYMKSRKES